jgi:hypothetical protein
MLGSGFQGALKTGSRMERPMFVMLYGSKFEDKGPMFAHSAKSLALLAKQLQASEVEDHAKIDWSIECLMISSCSRMKARSPSP